MICLTAATVDEVARQIKRLPPKSSPSDCLSVSLLKASVDVMAPLLHNLPICALLPEFCRRNIKSAA